MENQSVTSAQQFSEERFTKINIIKNERSTAFLLNFLPGQIMKAHNHPGRELYLNVLEGNGTFSIDGKDLEVVKGDVIYCDPEEQIGFTNNGEDQVSIYATMTKIKD
ncbi:cupin domain-containing protein [Virgibacillus ainsalahensis]